MSKMQKPAQQTDSAMNALALATLTGVSLLSLTGCEKDAPAPAKQNTPPQQTVHVQVAKPSLSAKETVTLTRAFSELAQQSRTDKNAAALFAALQDPRVRDAIIALRDGQGTLLRNQFEGDPELGKGVVRVLQHAFNDVNRSVPPRIREIQRKAHADLAKLPAEKSAADKELTAAIAAQESFYATNKSWNLELDKRVSAAKSQVEAIRYTMQWGPQSPIATYKEDSLKPVSLDGDFGKKTDVAAATAFARIRFLDESSPPLHTSQGKNDTGLAGRHIKALVKYSPGLDAWLKADGKSIHECAQAAITPR